MQTYIQISGRQSNSEPGMLDDLGTTDSKTLSTTGYPTNPQYPTLVREDGRTTTATADQAQGLWEFVSENNQDSSLIATPATVDQAQGLWKLVSEDNQDSGLTATPANVLPQPLQPADLVQGRLNAEDSGVASTTTTALDRAYASSTSSVLDVAFQLDALRGPHFMNLISPPANAKYSNNSNGAVRTIPKPRQSNLDALVVTQATLLRPPVTAKIMPLTWQNSAMTLQHSSSNTKYVTPTSSQYAWQSTSISHSDDGAAASKSFRLSESSSQVPTQATPRLADIQPGRPLSEPAPSSSRSRAYADHSLASTTGASLIVTSRPEIIGEETFLDIADYYPDPFRSDVIEDEMPEELDIWSAIQEPIQRATRERSQDPSDISSASITVSSSSTAELVRSEALPSNAKPGIYFMHPDSPVSSTLLPTSTFAVRASSASIGRVQRTSHARIRDSDLVTRSDQTRRMTMSAQVARHTASRMSSNVTSSVSPNKDAISQFREAKARLDKAECKLHPCALWKRLRGLKKKPTKATTATSSTCIPTASVTPTLGITIKEPSKLDLGILMRSYTSANLTTIKQISPNRTGTVFEIVPGIDSVYSDNGLRQFGYDPKHIKKGTPVVMVPAVCSHLKTTGFTVNITGGTIIAPQELNFYLLPPDYGLSLVRCDKLPEESWYASENTLTKDGIPFTQLHVLSKELHFYNMTTIIRNITTIGG